MVKKLFILLVVLVGGVIAWVPWWSSKLAEKALENPRKASSPEILQKAIEIKNTIYLYAQAGALAEQGVILFPEAKNYDYFLNTAAFCARKDSKPEAAIFWYKMFIETFPKHRWTDQAKSNLKKLEELYGDGKSK